MKSTCNYTISDFRQASWDKEHIIRLALSNKTPFKTRAYSEPSLYGANSAEKFGPVQNKSFCTARTDNACPHCTYLKGSVCITAYCVYSYDVPMFLVCKACGYTYCDASWYSKSTRVLQTVLACVFSKYKIALDAQLEKERLTRKYWSKQGKKDYEEKYSFVSGHSVDLEDKIMIYVENGQDDEMQYEIEQKMHFWSKDFPASDKEQNSAIVYNSYYNDLRFHLN